MFSTSLLVRAEDFLRAARRQNLKVATAESCTGGLVAGLLTEIPGSSDVLERGWVVYSNPAKHELLGVQAELLRDFGAVSAEVARAMAEGALMKSVADLSIAITGVAGPGGGTTAKPVGLVYFAAARHGMATQVDVKRFGALGRREIRLKSVENALALLTGML